MTKFKRFSAAVAATLMAACMVAPMATGFSASAAANYVSFEGETVGEHTYVAYKIFKGDAEASGFDSKVELKNVDWAMDATNAAAFLEALQNDDAFGDDFANCTSAPDVVGVLTTYETDSTKAKAFAAFAVTNKQYLTSTAEGADGTINLTEDGYYVIEETTLAPDTNGDGAKTLYLLGVYDADTGAEISVKSSIPSVEKKIQENVKTGEWQDDDTYGVRYNDTADFSIGDTVPFKLIGTIPSTIGTYDTYQYVFHDTLGKEFTVDTENFAPTVTVGTTVLTPTSATADTDAETGITTITIDFEDIKAAATAAGVTLSDTSKVVVTYDAVLNENAVIGQPGQTNEVYLEYSNNPNNGGDGTSHTKVDKVIAFTYELDVTKIDGANPDLKLEGAEFKLQATDGANAGKWVIVDDETYRITGWSDTEEGASTLTSGSDGVFKVIGLDDGAYSLKETQAPGIYNLLTEPITFTITADTNNAQNDDTIDGTELETLQIKVGTKEAVGGDVDTGIVAMDVENNSGASLPGTGGIGTTLFYLGGGAMVAVAGVYLISKKRMNNADAE